MFGIPKEMLPIRDGVTCLENAIQVANKIGDPIVISNVSKLPLHASLIDAPIMLQRSNEPELYGAIRTGLQSGYEGGLILADTVTDFSTMDIDTEADICFGVFRTAEPERFSVLLEDRIATKEKLPGWDNYYQAWGVVLWSRRVSDFLLTIKDVHYDRAFEQAIQRFGGYSTFPLHYYYDLGTFDSYVDYIADHHIFTVLT